MVMYGLILAAVLGANDYTLCANDYNVVPQAVKAVAVAPVKVVRKVVSRCVGGVCRQEVIEVQATSGEQPSVVVKAVATTEVRRTVQRSRFRIFRGR
jgi:hypothetical protein